jgi:hypothetical protein
VSLLKRFDEDYVPHPTPAEIPSGLFQVKPAWHGTITIVPISEKSKDLLAEFLT